MIPDDTHLLIDSLMLERMDQIDLTGPFEVTGSPLVSAFLLPHN